MHNDRGFWRDLLSARGRNGRARFWKVIGLVWLTVLVAGVTAFTADGWPLPVLIAAMGLAMLLLLAALYANMANIIKRLHDVGSSGWWLVVILLANFVFGLGSIAIIALGFIKGDPRPNRFGPPPGGERLEEVFA